MYKMNFYEKEEIVIVNRYCSTLIITIVWVIFKIKNCFILRNRRSSHNVICV